MANHQAHSRIVVRQGELIIDDWRDGDPAPRGWINASWYPSEAQSRSDVMGACMTDATQDRAHDRNQCSLSKDEHERVWPKWGREDSSWTSTLLETCIIEHTAATMQKCRRPGCEMGCVCKLPQMEVNCICHMRYNIHTHVIYHPE